MNDLINFARELVDEGHAKDSLEAYKEMIRDLCNEIEILEAIIRGYQEGVRK